MHSLVASRVRLGTELRKLREAAGISLEQAAEELECDLPTIRKIEAGRATIRPGEVKVLLDLYGVTDRDRVRQLARDARRRPGAAGRLSTQAG